MFPPQRIGFPNEETVEKLDLPGGHEQIVVDRADRLAGELAAGLADARRRASQLPRRPLVYFEEWDQPMISGIAWVSELIETAGGTDIFADRAGGKSATERIVTAEEIIAR